MMPLTTIGKASLHNLVDTYMALGRAAGNGEQIVGKGVSGYASAFPHPISNFAIVNDLTVNLSQDLKLIAEQRKAFHVYLYDDCINRQSRALMKKAGFKCTHILNVMTAPPTVQPGSLPLNRAETETQRETVARFMLSQFSSAYPEWIIDEVMRATTTAEGLDLYTLVEESEVVAAMMLRRNDSCIGLYNLCVRHNQRGRGYGKMLVQMTRRFASTFRQPVVLQCDRSLVGWYQNAGFVKAGKIEVYLLAQSRW